MPESNHLCGLWEHAIFKVFKHDSKSELGLMFKQWINFKNFNSILNYPIDDFTQSGNLCYMNEHGNYVDRNILEDQELDSNARNLPRLI